MRRSIVAACGMAVALALTCTGVASAEPVPLPGTGSTAPGTQGPPMRSGPAHVVRVDELAPNLSAVYIDSPSMARTVEIELIHPPAGAGPRPSYYLLDGVDAPDIQSSWTKKTDVVSFFAGKNVNVVMPVGGTGSYYTDWQQVDPTLGWNRWETFLTQELPPIIDSQFGGNGRNAIAGLSMGGQSALILATRHPQLYRAVAAFSSCPDVSQQYSKDLIRATVGSRGGNANNMWGPDSDPAWAAHDPTLHAANLHGMTVYLSVGNGLPGPHELSLRPDLGTVIAEGGPLETAANMCTHQFQQRLNQVGVPATVVYRPWGTHSWPYWQDDLHDSWPTVAAALGI
ncbi:esterase family protein [Skermania sp. ID1734]|uniref:alpha/beta hydrolase n=1 Tax=Skermania sp. ID1734 TaxID=2597516 RepID=UPI0011803314|nr:alpha/beta hydrolase family protein [Skermania sp. ID1734]TSE00698.1 esterase family protein [Skermania sp. ID1734]